MQSELENLKNGVIVETPDYRDGKRIIGIVESTVKSVNGNIPPLSKQNAFTVVEKPTVQNDVLQPTMENQAEPSLETVTMGVAPNSFQSSNNDLEKGMTLNGSSEIPVMENQLESPIQTSNPSVLESLVGDVTNIGKQAVEGISNKLEAVAASTSLQSDFSENVELPKIDEPVIAQEPNELDNSLFMPENFNQENTNINENVDNINAIPTEILQQENNVKIEDNPEELIKTIESKKAEISDKIAKYMIAASNMLVEEIVELIKEEIKSKKDDSNINTLNNTDASVINNQNDTSSMTLNL